MAQTKSMVDNYLTEASNAYVPSDISLIADKVLPTIKKKNSSGLLAGYGNDHLRLVNTTMGGRGQAPRIQSVVRKSDSYQIENNGLEGIVTKDDYDNVEQPFDAEKDETLGLTTLLKVGREKALADVLTNSSLITQTETLSGTSQFNDYSNSAPLTKFKAAQVAVKGGCGVAANTAILSWEVAQTLKYHPEILSVLGFAQNRAGALTYDGRSATTCWVGVLQRFKARSG